MSAITDFLAANWLPVLLEIIGLLLLAAGLRGRRWGRIFVGGVLVMAGLGGCVSVPMWAALWMISAAASVLAALVFVLLLVGAWSPPAASLAGAVGVFGIAGITLPAVGRRLVEFGRALAEVELLAPWWLLLLAALPLFVWMSRRRLNRREGRPWLALTLRCLGVAALALALAEPRLRQLAEHVTVLFVVDRSQSVPEELGDDPNDPGRRVDLRTVRIRDFLNRAVAARGKGHERDQAGLIVFGRRPRLELPPSDAPRFNLQDLPPATDGSATDIGAALKLALASFPEGTGKRILLASDGNENLGSAEEQARLAHSLGVQIDVLPLAARQRNQDEVLVERVEAPPVIEQGSRIPLRVLVRSFNPHIVVGKLSVKQITEDGTHDVGDRIVRLRLGLNAFSFTRPLTNEQRSYTYEAEFQPEYVEDEKGDKIQDGLPGDRVQNNRASAHVVARGRRRILLLEGKKDEHRFLSERLKAAGEGKFQVYAEPITALERYNDRDQLAVYLSNFDCVILANVSAEQVSEERQEVLRSNTHDQGCGLVMIGGPESYGAGGWQNTAVEKALPVDSEIQSLEVQGKGGLVLIMHASEMADGNLWQKRIAKLAVERLSPVDEVGIIVWDGNHNWHVPLQRIGGNRAAILGQIDKMQPSDMPDFDGSLQMANDALMDPKKEIATKHVILISDGDPQCTMAILPRMKANKITVTTVGVACHGPQEDQKMAAIAKATKGRYYGPNTKPGTSDPRQLPAIYIKESRVVSQSFLHERPFRPILVFRSGPTDRLPDPLPQLLGFVRTSPKPSPLVEVPIRSPKIADQDFPLLATWHYGLGKAVAFTSDAGDPKFWSREWAEGGMFARFWEQVVEWSLRPTERGRLLMTTEHRDGKVHITVEARTDDNRPDDGLLLRGGVTGPPNGRDGAAPTIRFVQTNSGQYEATVDAREAGSYFVTAQAVRVRKVLGKDGKEHEVEEGVDSVRAGVTLPYSPEFSELESNTALLEHLRELTDGKTYEDDEVSLRTAAQSGDLFRPVPDRVRGRQALWPYLVALACLLLLCDVAVRRLAIDVGEVVQKAEKIWDRLRGRAMPPPELAEQTQPRRAEVTDDPTARGSRRFEGSPVTGAPLATDEPARPTTQQPPPQPPAQRQPQQPEDYLDAMRRAKRRVWEERDKDKGQGPGGR
jgi:uncharacterized membrane protein